MTNLKTQLKTIEENTQSRLTKVEDRLANIDVSMDAKMDVKLKTMKGDLATEITNKVKETLQNEVRTEIKEIEDQKQRSLNLICFNVPECSDSKSGEDRKKHDITTFIRLCEYIGVKDPDIKLAFRLGNYKSGSVKPRPLKIIMNNKKQRKDILDNTSKIKSLPTSTGLNKSIIVKDLTVRQRDENKKRRAERAKTVNPKVTQNPQIPTSSNNVFNEDTIHDSTVIEATIENIRSEEEMDDEIQSQRILIYKSPIMKNGTSLSADTQTHGKVQSPSASFLDFGEETVIGGINTLENNLLDVSSIRDNEKD